MNCDFKLRNWPVCKSSTNTVFGQAIRAAQGLLFFSLFCYISMVQRKTCICIMNRFSFCLCQILTRLDVAALGVYYWRTRHPYGLQLHCLYILNITNRKVMERVFIIRKNHPNHWWLFSLNSNRSLVSSVWTPPTSWSAATCYTLMSEAECVLTTNSSLRELFERHTKDSSCVDIRSKESELRREYAANKQLQ